MTLKYFFSLYARNMKEMLPLVSIVSFGILLAPAIFTAIFLPISFPIVALIALTALSGLVLTPIFGLIKTMIDWNTRKFTPKEEIPGIINAIKCADDKLIEQCRDELLNYEPQSKSSKSFIKWLGYSRKNTENAIERKENKEKLRMMCEELTINPWEISSKMLEDYSLTSENQMKLEAYRSKILSSLRAKLNAKSLWQVRLDIEFYLENKNNNGKETYQRTVSFFKAATMQTANASLEENNQDLSAGYLKL